MRRYVGVHENMCILERPFGIERVRGMGFSKQNLAVVRDLVDIMCATLRPPRPSVTSCTLPENVPS